MRIGWMRYGRPTIAARFCSPAALAVGQDIIRIWDEQKFAPADVLDFVSMAERLKPHLAKYAVTAPRAWISERPMRRRRKTQN
jgi:hypothetical protein